jgi:hypothetical protein
VERDTAVAGRAGIDLAGSLVPPDELPDPFGTGGVLAAEGGEGHARLVIGQDTLAEIEREGPHRRNSRLEFPQCLEQPPNAQGRISKCSNPKPDGHPARVLAALRERNPAAHAALAVAEELMAMIRKTSATTLADWLAKAVVLGDRDLVNLAASLRPDAAAVQTALTEAWSNGQVEGQVG